MIQKDNPERLVQKAMRGNRDAFGQLIHIHKDYLYRMAFLYMKNEDAALDVVQESILHAYEAIRELKQGTEAAGIFQNLDHEDIDKLRKNGSAEK